MYNDENIKWDFLRKYFNYIKNYLSIGFITIRTISYRYCLLSNWYRNRAESSRTQHKKTPELNPIQSELNNCTKEHQ